VGLHILADEGHATAQEASMETTMEQMKRVVVQTLCLVMKTIIEMRPRGWCAG
jgi:hypothetical protein